MSKYQITATVYDKKGRILGIGQNNYLKSHPVQKKYAVKVGLPEKLYLHAEMLAIIRALKLGTPFSIKVERYGKDGRPLNATPCPICTECIRESGISFVTHTMG